MLEIGCGWGGFAERAAADSHHVTGLTISPAQHKFATERLNGAADIRLEDYRRCKGSFDNIVSIEMFEAVGEHYWPAYFATVAERLKRGGRAIIQTITIQDELFAGYRTRSDFVRHYVFPGGMLPSPGALPRGGGEGGPEIRRRLRLRQGLCPHPARMAGADAGRRKAQIKALGHDQQFLRNWEFYLGICAATFEVARTDVVQVELVNA